MVLVLKKLLDLRVFESQISLKLVDSNLLTSHLLGCFQELVLHELQLSESIEAILVGQLPAVLRLLGYVFKFLLQSLDLCLPLRQLLLQKFAFTLRIGVTLAEVAALQKELDLADGNLSNLFE
jgi:hypothetical protein